MLVNKYLALGAGAVVVALSVALWWQTDRLATAHTQNGVLAERLEQAVAANKTNMGVIGELKKANADLLERIRLDVAAATAAAQAAGERARELQRQRDAARQRLSEALSASPSCEALGAMDLAAACPAFGERLLDLYQRSRPD